MWDSIKKGLQVNRPIEEGDENTPANTLGNMIIDKAGLPKEWMQSAADEKRIYNNMPEQMGMAGMGSVNKITGEAAQALAKLQAAKEAGQKLPAALEYALSQATGKVPVVKTAQEMAEQKVKDAVSLANTGGGESVAEKFQRLGKYLGK